MKIGSAFPSSYIKCDDLQGKAVRLRMSHTKQEEIGDGEKPVLYFVGKEKGMVLNRTNANTIAAVYGEETDDWRECEIEIYPTETDFQGKRVPAIRVRIPRGDKQPVAQGAGHAGMASRVMAPNARTRAEQYDERNPPPATAMAAELDDDIPF